MKLFEAANISARHRDVWRHYAGQVGRGPQMFHCINPNHNDSTASVKVYDSSNDSYCFGCQTRYTNVDLVAAILGMSPADAAQQICRDFNISYDEPEKKDVNPVWTDDFDKYKSVLAYIFKLSRDMYLKHKLKWAAKRGLPTLEVGYLVLGNQTDGQPLLLSTKIKQMLPSLKITDDDLVRYGVIYPSGVSPFYQRYIIPLRNKDGDIVGLIGRRNPTEDKEYATLLAADPAKAKTYNDTHPKYYNSIEVKAVNNPDGSENYPLFKKGDHLFNFDNARFSKDIFVVEGPMDALSLMEMGHRNVVALMGSAMTQRQFELLKNKNIILCLDNDDAGQLATYKTLVKFRDATFFKVYKLDQYKDFNEALVNGYVPVIKPQPAPFWLVGYVVKANDWSTDEGRCAAWQMFAQYCGANTKAYAKLYPVNINYLPPTLFEAWRRFNKLYRK